jgi:hypothetical protein
MTTISNTNISTTAVQSSSSTITTTTTVDSPSGVDAGVIAGAVFGTLYVIIVVSLIVYCFLKQKREKKSRPPPAEDTLEAIHQRLQREDTIKANLNATAAQT